MVLRFKTRITLLLTLKCGLDCGLDYCDNCGLDYCDNCGLVGDCGLKCGLDGDCGSSADGLALRADRPTNLRVHALRLRS